MKAVLILVLGLISLAGTRGKADYNVHFPPLENTLMSRQTPDTCTERQLLLFSLRIDVMCPEYGEMAGDIVGRYYNSTFESFSEGQTPSPPEDLADDVRELLDSVCTDTCFGAFSDLLSECTPDEDEDFVTEEDLTCFNLLCGSNGDYRCPLLPSEISNLTVLGNTVVCVVDWAESDPDNFMCNPSCNDFVNAFLSETECCGTSVLNLMLQDANTSVDGYYTTCGIQGPGICSPDIAEGSIDGDDVISGDCTRDQLLTFYETFDSQCENDIDQLEPAFDEYFESFETRIPNLEVVNQLDMLLPAVCTDACVGALADLLSECIPDNFTTPQEVQEIGEVCAHNGDYYCVLAPFQDDGLSIFTLNTAIDCSLDWLNNEAEYVCSSVCKEATETIVEEVECCATSIFNLLFTEQNTTLTADGYYQVCNIEGTDGCLASFEDSSGIGMFASVGLILVGALISAAF